MTDKNALPAGMTGYEIAVNVPGYSPESWTGSCRTIEDARLGLINELKDTLRALHVENLDEDQEQPYGDENAINAALKLAETANVDESIMFGGYAHTIVFSDIEE